MEQVQSHGSIGRTLGAVPLRLPHPDVFLSAHSRRRERRVARLVAALQHGTLPARARVSEYRQTAATELAHALRDVLPPAEIQERLARVGLCSLGHEGELSAVCLWGGGIRVSTPSGGCVLTGPAVDRNLLTAFPELLPMVLVNSEIYINPISGGAGCSDPATTGTGPVNFNLSVVSRIWKIKKAVVGYQVFGTNNLNIAMTADVNDDYHSGSFSINNGSGTSFFSEWPTTWVKKNAGVTNAIGSTVTITLNPNGNTQWSASATPDGILITYLAVPCPIRRPGVLTKDACPSACRRPLECPCQGTGTMPPGSPGTPPSTGGPGPGPGRNPIS